MRLTKKEKTLILFMGESSIGTVSIMDGTPDQKTLIKLDANGLVKYHKPLIPFLTFGTNYWSLSPKGWEVLASLKEAEKMKKVKVKKKKVAVKKKTTKTKKLTLSKSNMSYLDSCQT